MPVNALNRESRVYVEDVDPNDFPVEFWIHDPDLSAVAGVDPAYWVITGDVVSSMTAQEIADLEAVRLPRARAAKLNAIDQRTSELIDQGFEYPAASGKTFSLSLESQSNIHGVYTARNRQELTYPIHWLTKDDNDSVDLADAAAVEAFFLTAVGTIRAHKDSGSTLKEAVMAATTTAEVLAVEDSR